MTSETYDVGGTIMPRPFKIQRFGHLALCVDDLEATLHFYSDLLGMNVSDSLDFSAMFERQTPGRDGNAYFLNLASDHHSTVIFPRWTMPPRKLGPRTQYVSHLAWQVGTMSEIINGGAWLTGRFTQVRPGTRDPAGANYNATVYDPETLPNEIYYGMDQIGWSGCSKPASLWPEHDLPLPAAGEAIAADFPAVRAAIEAGAVDLKQGLHRRPKPEGEYDVDGVILPRPFRLIRNSPIGLFVDDVDRATEFYRDGMGLTVTASIAFEGRKCVYLRANTEHHSLALLPAALATKLGLREDSVCAFYGLQVQNYRQLRAAIGFLKQNSVAIKTLPSAILPGIDYAALAMAPDGHAVLLYYRMEQVGWDGRTQPAAPRPDTPVEDWPDTIAATPGTLSGAVFQGPLG